MNYKWSLRVGVGKKKKKNMVVLHKLKPITVNNKSNALRVRYCRHEKKKVFSNFTAYWSNSVESHFRSLRYASDHMDVFICISAFNNRHCHNAAFEKSGCRFRSLMSKSKRRGKNLPETIWGSRATRLKKETPSLLVILDCGIMSLYSIKVQKSKDSMLKGWSLHVNMLKGVLRLLW